MTWYGVNFNFKFVQTFCYFLKMNATNVVNMYTFNTDLNVSLNIYRYQTNEIDVRWPSGEWQLLF